MGVAGPLPGSESMRIQVGCLGMSKQQSADLVHVGYAVPMAATPARPVDRPVAHTARGLSTWARVVCPQSVAIIELRGRAAAQGHRLSRTQAALALASVGSVTATLKRLMSGQDVPLACGVGDRVPSIDTVIAKRAARERGAAKRGPVRMERVSSIGRRG